MTQAPSLLSNDKDKSNISPLWDSVKELYQSFDLNTFRSIGGVNNRLGIWSARDGSTRYYKSLMYEFALYLSEIFEKQNIYEGLKMEDLLPKIQHQNLGSPHYSI